MNYTFKGKLIQLVTQEKCLPNGRRINLESIKHPGASLIVPFLSRDKIIFIKQFRPVIDQYIYELPAGTIERGETPLACAKREIVEEIGCSAKSMELIGKIYPVPGYSTEIISIFKAEQLQKENIRNEPDEVIQVIPLTKTRIKKLFRTRKIMDAKTICALAFCGWI